MSKVVKKKETKKRTNKYDEKLIVTGTFSDLLKASKKDAEKTIQKRKEEKNEKNEIKS